MVMANGHELGVSTLSAAAAAAAATATTHSSKTSNGALQKNATPNTMPLVRKKPGGIQVSTVKRVAPPPKASSTSSSSASSSTSNALRINGLSDEKRQRVEEIRRDREIKRRAEEEKLRPPKVTSNKSREASTSKRRKLANQASEDDEDGDDLFSVGSETSKRQKRREKPSLQRSQMSNSGDGYRKLDRRDVLPHYLVPRHLIDEDAFATAPEGFVKDIKARQSSSLVHEKQYGAFFLNLSEEYPKVSLEYPALDCREYFSLLVPKDRDEYDPISDLLRTVRCIVEFYLTPEQQELFGSLDSLEIGSAAGHLLSVQGKGLTPVSASRETSVFDSEVTHPVSNTRLSVSSSLQTGNTRDTTPTTSSTTLSALDSPVGVPMFLPPSPARSTLYTNVTSASSPIVIDSPASSNADPDSILRSLTKARNRRDGLLFIRTVHRFNTTLLNLKNAGKIEENVRKMGETGVNEGIWRCLQEQCYARTVAPRVEELSKYEAFSDNVYGELLPRFMSEICQLTRLGPESVFVDLGSGVGNLLIQVALQTGSESIGCEQMKIPAELASMQVKEATERWKMWGLCGGKSIQAWQGDFGEDVRVQSILRKADVVLVNNYAFTAPTNDKLSLQFLDLKDGCQVVSLKPFVPADFRLTERTLSSPLAILKVAQRYYTSGCVSWADGGGKYYIHTVDRSMITTFLDAREAHSTGQASKDISCLKASTQVSCQSSYTVDPNSFATCCYNGALKTGLKESGLVLATQFYDTNPSTGPKDSTTIHGLWPDYCDGTYPQYCTNDSGIPEMTGSQIQALLQEYNEPLLDYMKIYYKDVGGDDPSFWEHEYNKHGTCYTTLRPKCQIPRPGMNQTTAAVVGYFEEIALQFERLPTFRWLADAGITPSTTKTYSKSQIQSVLAQKHGGIPYLGCVNSTTLDEFWYFFHTRGPLVGGQYLAIDSTTPSSCGDEISFIPK
ncbi:hypothetical protein CBS101457_003998 [Exobasidium rhododendri]|nr:hypothetical protein CBS101457_003998 [Exobasidium rhododendri]